jgi:hypothetical protein
MGAITAACLLVFGLRIWPRPRGRAGAPPGAPSR